MKGDPTKKRTTLRLTASAVSLSPIFGSLRRSEQLHVFLRRAKLEGLAVTQDCVNDVRELAHDRYTSHLFGLLRTLLLVIISESRILVCAVSVPRNVAYRRHVQHRAHLGRSTLGQLVFCGP